MQIHGPSAVVTSVEIDTFGGPGAVALRFPASISGQQPYELPASRLVTVDGAE